jgi:outer membrane receptor protein involved in Fe transport
LIVSWQSPAIAQAAAEPTSVQASAASGQGQNVAAGEDQGFLQDIVVTAQKREESLQNVPASISVLTGARLEELHGNSLTEYASYLPGVTAFGSGSPGQNTIVLRGVRPITGGQTTGTYIDDVPFGSSGAYSGSSGLALDLLPYDLDRLEVLRGPQGTLYGASSMGGLIKYALKPADTSEASLRVGTELSTVAGAGDLGWGVRGTANVPVVDDVLGIRASAFAQRTPGFINHVVVSGVGPDGVPNAFQTRAEDVNEVVQLGGRLAVQWAITPDVNLKLNGLFQKTLSDSNSGASTNRDTLQPLAGRFDTIRYLREPFKSIVRFGSATLNADLGFATFTSATGYSEYRTDRVQDATLSFLPPGFGFVADFNTRSALNKFTQEFRLASPSGGMFEWLVGAFYTKESARNNQVARILSDATPTSPPQPFLSPFIAVAVPTTFKEYAAFGDITFRPAPQFDITGGLRWAKNKQTFRQNLTQFDANGDFVADPVPTTIAFPGESDESVVTYMVNSRYRFSDDLMAYARVANGYRPGGPNAVIPVPPGFPPLPTSFEADKLTNYEVGLKGNVARRLQFDISGYQIDWRNIQQNQSFGTFGAIVNAGKVRIRGAELETVLLVGPRTRLGFNAGYTDTELRNDVQGFGNRGDRLPSIPKWTAALTADQDFTLGGVWDGKVGAGLRYVGRRTESRVVNAALGIRDVEGIKVPSFTLIDLNAGVNNGKWNFSVFARNITNQRALQIAADRSTGAPGTFFADVSYSQPRTFGVSLDTNF